MEETILQTLLTDPDYFSKCFTHLKERHFDKIEHKTIFRFISEYYKETENYPKIKEIALKIKNSTLKENLKNSTLIELKTLIQEEKIKDIDFLLKETEKFIRTKELTDAILKSADIIQNQGDTSQILGMIEKSLNIHFDNEIGLDYNSNISERIDYYQTKNFGMTTGIQSLDREIGGLRKKTLNIVAAVTHGGKSAFMVSIAAAILFQKKNVLYITLEMPEYEISKRIDANILNLEISELTKMEKTTIISMFEDVRPKLGRLIIKEYPATTFDVLMLKNLVNELKNKKDFYPDIVIIDYLGLMKSSKGTIQTFGGSYGYLKSISEELHGFSKSYDVCILTASQINRSGYNNENPGIDTISESLGLSFTSDVLLLLVSTEEMRKNNQMLINIKKNRNLGNLSSVLIGCNFKKMMFYDIDAEKPKIEKNKEPEFKKDDIFRF